jgi:DNA-binding transcriptional LysR family regulator
MIIRHLEYLSALARERHFARAAKACRVTQSTLSAGIKQMEDSLGVLMVERGQRFQGFTPEGEKALEWAQHVISDFTGLRQQLSQMRRGLAGHLRIGAIPATQPVISCLTEPFLRLHPETSISIRSMSSAEIQRGLDEFSLDVGVTYLDNEPLVRVRRLQLYAERYVFLSQRTDELAARTHITWSEAAQYPLCVLTPNMQNRRILDAHFREAGIEPRTVLETDTFVALWSHLRKGLASAVVPQAFVRMIDTSDCLCCLPLVTPDAAHAVGLVAPDREPLAPVARALFDIVKQHKLGQQIAAQLQELPEDKSKDRIRNIDHAVAKRS